MAARHGTPTHVFAPDRLDRRLDAFLAAFTPVAADTRLYYSVKTNYLPSLCRQLAGRGIGADVVSGYELAAALRAGFEPTRIVFNGPVKTGAELTEAVRLGVQVNIDGAHEVAMLDQLAADAGGVVPVGIRLAPGLPLATSADPSYRHQIEQSARRSRFGWPVGSPQLAAVIADIASRSRLRLVSVHCHLGSQIVHEQALRNAIDAVLAEAGRLHQRFGLREINIGGGFGIPGIQRPRIGPLGTAWTLAGGQPPTDPEPELDVAAFFAWLAPALAKNAVDELTVACEPGRWLVSDTMATLTSVASRKELPDARWLILDAGNNVAPWTGTGERHRFVPLGRTHSATTVPWSVAGPLCYENDLHGHGIVLPADLDLGDLVCIHDTGAYSIGRSSNFIRTRAAVVALDGDGGERVVWRAETLDDVFAFEPEGRDTQ